MKTLLITTLLSLGLLGVGIAPSEAQDDELLEPKKAFAFSAELNDTGLIRATYRIADGYYLYDDKLEFSSQGAEITLGEPTIPDGTIKNDEFFGEVEIHRGTLMIEVPVKSRVDGTRTLELRAKSQGCADMGVCYPPLIQTASLELPALGEAASAGNTAGDEPTASSGSDSAAVAQLQDLNRAIGLPEDEPLPPEQAFVLSVQPTGARSLEASFAVAPGYYLYKERLSFELASADPAIASIELPDGKMKEDEFFGRMEVFERDFSAQLAVARDGAGERPVTLTTRYQGCAEEWGICYPPQTTQVNLVLPAASASDAAASEAANAQADPADGSVVADGPAADSAAAPSDATGPSSGEVVSAQDRIAQLLSGGNILLILGIMLGSGILLAFTPCVFPMVPILSGIIVGQGDSLTPRKGFALSFTYVQGVALVYALVGIVIGIAGASLNLQVMFQNPIALGLFAALFVLLALAMFGFYELQLPAGVQARLSQMSNSQQGGTYTGAFLMGMLSALIVGPCVGPVLAGVLVFISTSEDWRLGGLYLYALGLGTGIPLIAAGTLGGHLLPKAGTWMTAIKAVFGVLLLAVAIWLLSRVLPAQITMVLWAGLLIVAAVYMGVFDALPRDEAAGWRRLWKGVGLVMFVYGTILLIGAAAGGRAPLQPLQGIVQTSASQGSTQAVSFQSVKGVDGLEAALARAESEGQPVMLDFYADWCVTCKEMEHATFSNADVASALEPFVVLKTDVTANDAQDRDLYDRFGIFGPPAIMFFDPTGEEHRNYRVVGFMNAERFKTHVEQFRREVNGQDRA